MDTATEVRIAYFEALKNLEYKGISIPVFDEQVDNNDLIAQIDNADEVYILMQSQQTIDDSTQTYCEYRLISDMTIKIVTKFTGAGDKSISENIGFLVNNLIKGARTESKLTGINDIKLDVSRSLFERSNSQTAFSKVFIYRNYINN